MRFCLDPNCDLLALGNQVGKVFIWDMSVDDPNKMK